MKLFKKSIACLIAVLMVVSSLPFTAMTALAADKVVFDFSANKGNTSGWAYDNYEENGHWYDVMASDGSESYSIADSKINFNHAVAFCNDGTVRDYVQSNAWTVEFNAKANDAGDYAFYALGGAEGDFVRLDTNGSFMANGIWTNVAIDSLNYTDYAISYNGSSVKLYVNGIEVANINTTLNVKLAGNGTLYSALGWSDTCGKAKIYGEYTSYSISDTVFDSDAYIMSKITADLANNANAESFNAKAYHTWNEAVGGYSNVVYQKSDSTAWNSNYVGISGFSVKIAIPSNIVLAYDGVNSVRQPVVLETKSSNGNGGPVIRTAFPTDRTLLAFADGGYWRGDHNTDYSLYRYNDTTSKIGYAPYKDLDTDSQDNKNTARFWYNTLSYVGTGNIDTYYDHIGTLQWNIYAGEKSSSCKDNFVESYGNTYVINYKPAYDILSSDDFKTLYNKVYDNQDDYTADSLKAYLIAAYKMATLDVNHSFGSVTNETIGGVVASVASLIKNTVAEYNTAVANLELLPTADLTALNAAVTALKTEKEQSYYTAKYNGAARTKASQLLTEAEALQTSKNQDTVDTCANAIQTLLNSRDSLQSYTVDVSVVDDETTDKITATVNGGGEYKYGDTANLSVMFANIMEGSLAGRPEYIVNKWVLTVNHNDYKVASSVNMISDVVKGNASYICYALSADASNRAENTTRVRFIDKSNRTVAFKSTENNVAITAGQFDVAAPIIPFYEFVGWELVNGDENSPNFTEVVYKATYKYADIVTNKNTIIGLDGVLVEGVGSYTAYYDELVTLSGATAYAYADEYGNQIAPILGDKIYAPRAATTYIIAVKEDKAAATVTGYTTFAQNGHKTLAVNAQVYVPAGKSIQEAGIVISKSNADPTIGGVNSTKVPATLIGDKNQFTFNMNYSQPGTVYVKAYVIVDGTPVYSAVSTIVLN